MIDQRQQLLSLKRDLLKVRGHLVDAFKSKDTVRLNKAEKSLLESYNLINKQLCYNGLLTRLDD